MSSWNARERLAANPSDGITLGASVTKQPLSLPTPVTADGAIHLVAAAKVSSFTGSPVLLLQTSVDGSTWTDLKSSTVSATGVVTVSLAIEKAGDQTYLPLLSQVRLVGTTAGGEALVISDVWFLQAV